MNQTTSRLHEPRPRAAVIGAGVSGLVCAHTLLDRGIEIAVFEKSRGIGGRTATRRTAGGPRFDHGAQYFTVRDERFEHSVKSWTQNGVVAPWGGRVCSLVDGRPQLKESATQRFVGVPGMNSICRHLAVDLDIRLNTQVIAPEQRENTWSMCDVRGRDLGEFDYVISSAPAPQSAELLAGAPNLQQQAMLTKMRACWASMVSFDESQSCRSTAPSLRNPRYPGLHATTANLAAVATGNRGCSMRRRIGVTPASTKNPTRCLATSLKPFGEQQNPNLGQRSTRPVTGGDTRFPTLHSNRGASSTRS